MLYFSYGSNMSARRMLARVPTARRAEQALLPSHRLVFHKRGRDGSAKCDAHYTGRVEDKVVGVLFELPAAGKSMLDRYEGLGRGYAQKQVRVRTENGIWVRAMTYYATHIDSLLQPFSWYKIHVLTGARENRLPAAYVRTIKRVATIDDPDPERHTRELAVYL